MVKLSDYLIRNCKIAYKCEQQWEDFAKGKIPSIRHCNQCDREVVQCKTVKQLRNALMVNACVAVHFDVLDTKPNLLGVVVPLCR